MEKKAWYLEPEKYKWLLRQANLSEKEYLSAINAVIKIFPLDSSSDYTKGIMKREGGLSAPFYLHPVPFNVLKSHPVYTFMSGQVRDNNILAEIVNFGRDLEITADIPKIASVCKRLRNKKEYIGALFEIEILAALIRSGIQAEIIVTPDFRGRLSSGFLYLEATHRGVPFAEAVVGNVMLGIALQDFGNLSLKVGGVGNQGETVEQISEAIVSDVREILRNHPAEKTTVSGQSYEISHDPAGGPGHFSYSYGSYSYEGDLVHIVIRELKGKEKQLSDVRQHQGLRAVALDLRSLFPNLPPPDKYEAIAPGWLKYYRPRIRRWRTRVIWDVQQYLRSSNSIDAALIWWKHGRAAGLSTIKERFEYRFSVDVISGDHYWNASNCRELKTVLETAYSQRGCKKCLGVSMLRSLFERPTSWR